MDAWKLGIVKKNIKVVEHKEEEIGCIREWHLWIVKKNNFALIEMLTTHILIHIF